MTNAKISDKWLAGAVLALVAMGSSGCVGLGQCVTERVTVSMELQLERCVPSGASMSCTRDAQSLYAAITPGNIAANDKELNPLYLQICFYVD